MKRQSGSSSIFFPFCFFLYMVVTIHLRKSHADCGVWTNPTFDNKKCPDSSVSKRLAICLYEDCAVWTLVICHHWPNFVNKDLHEVRHFWLHGKGCWAILLALCFPTSMIFFCVVSCHFARLCSSKVALLKGGSPPPSYTAL